MRVEDGKKDQSLRESAELRQHIAELERKQEKALVRLKQRLKSEHWNINNSDVDRDRSLIVFGEATEETFGYERMRLPGKSVGILFDDSEEALMVEDMVRERTAELTETNEELQQEILERKRVEKALRDSERKYRELVENANSIILRRDIHGHIIFFNEYAQRFFGYTEDEILGQNIVGTIVPEIDTTGRNLAKMIQDIGKHPERYANNENENMKHSGERVWISWTNKPILDTNGDTTEVLCIGNDITERKQMEDELREAQRYARNIINSSLDMIIAVDDQRRITEFNKAAQAAFGYSRDEILGKYVDVLYDSPEVGLQVYVTTKETGEFIGEVANRRKNGESFPCFVSASILRGMEAEFIGVMGISRDITEGKKTEAELQKIQKLESVGVLAGGIAHDFNNILTAIMGNISLARIYAKSGRTADKVMEKLTAAEMASAQAQDLTQQLLTFARGGAPVKKMSSVAELLIDSVTFVSSGSNVKCEFSIPDDLWSAEVDEGQMNQVISNIIINAEQAMPHGGVIDVCADNVIAGAEPDIPLAAGGYIKISISDHGVGIRKENLQKIFDPYFTTKREGNGLGLAICYSIVRNHGGSIMAESQVGVGTTMHIYLPVCSEEILVIEERKEKEPIRGEGSILVMDDEKHIRDVAAEMLISIGYDVVTTIDGTEALELYREAMESGSAYDAVIMDLTIPGGMGGKETIRKLMEMDPDVNAIVSSGYSNDPIMSGFSEYGFRGVIAKPYEIRELSEVLHRVMTENAP